VAVCKRYALVILAAHNAPNRRRRSATALTFARRNGWYEQPMTDPEGNRSALAWCLWALSAAFAVGTVGFAILNRDTGIELAWPIAIEVGAGVVVITFATVGALVARRRPGHPIGWILLAAALLATYGAFAEQYAVYALYTDPGRLPGGTVMAWTATWLYIPSLLTAPAVLAGGRSSGS
jgi:hypothetical protein